MLFCTADYFSDLATLHVMHAMQRIGWNPTYSVVVQCKAVQGVDRVG